MATATSLKVSTLPKRDAKNAFVASFRRPLQASAQVGFGQFATLDASGYAGLNGGTTPGQLCVGIGDVTELSNTSTTAGSAIGYFDAGWEAGKANSAVTNDAFTNADFGVPFYIKDENTPGKLSNYSGSNRSLGGLVFGLSDLNRPVLWSGAVAALLARATLVSNSVVGGYAHVVVDALAATTTAEKTLARTPVHGTVSAVTFTSLGTNTANGTDYETINVYKADGAGGTHVLIASYDSRAATTGQGAIVAGVPVQFKLSTVAGALNLLETDILSYEILKAGAGQITPVGVLTVIQKVL
jgi:hypothetical protein